MATETDVIHVLSNTVSVLFCSVLFCSVLFCSTMSDFTDFFKNNIIKLYKLVLRRIMQAVLTIIHMAQYTYSHSIG